MVLSRELNGQGFSFPFQRLDHTPFNVAREVLRAAGDGAGMAHFYFPHAAPQGSRSQAAQNGFDFGEFGHDFSCQFPVARSQLLVVSCSLLVVPNQNALAAVG